MPGSREVVRTHVFGNRVEQTFQAGAGLGGAVTTATQTFSLNGGQATPVSTTFNVPIGSGTAAVSVNGTQGFSFVSTGDISTGLPWIQLLSNRQKTSAPFPPRSPTTSKAK